MSRKKSPDNHIIEAYDKHGDEIFRFCLLKLRNRENALDITQETFIKTWEYAKAGNTVREIRPFLYKTAYNLIVDFSRKKKTLSLEDVVNFETDLGSDEFKRTINSIDGKLAMKLLEGLTDHYRIIIEMKYLQGMTLDEIAQATGKRKQTISVQIHRAENTLRDLYKEKNE